MKDAEENQWYSWYTSFDQTYGPQKRRQWYSSVAEAYSWARPHYPDALVEGVIDQARLAMPSDYQSSILEIGCGPGIATAAFAARGIAVQGVEPSPAACELARQRCGTYEGVQIANATFEEWPLGAQTFDAVLAATSFHWVSPAVACKKSAAALKPDGSLILLWATPPQPSPEICQHLRSVYERYSLSALGEEQCRTQSYYQKNFETFAQIVNDSGFFQTSSVKIEAHHSIYSIKKYLTLLSTLSGYIALEETTRTDLLGALGSALAKRLDGNELTTEHWFAAQVSPLASR